MNYLSYQETFDEAKALVDQYAGIPQVCHAIELVHITNYLLMVANNLLFLTFNCHLCSAWLQTNQRFLRKSSYLSSPMFPSQCPWAFANRMHRQPFLFPQIVAGITSRAVVRSRSTVPSFPGIQYSIPILFHTDWGFY